MSRISSQPTRQSRTALWCSTLAETTSSRSRPWTPSPACRKISTSSEASPGTGQTRKARSADRAFSPRRAAGFRARVWMAQGFRARGHPAAAARSREWGQDRSALRRAKGFFCRWPCRTSRRFFHRRYPANSGATPPAVSPRVSGGHFVSAGRAISFRMTRR